MAGVFRFVVVVGLLAGAVAPARAQPPDHPRVGLALGGGSALGLAHVGVLQWFDEHRIPVDLIAGTSIGGLIGGAFACGMTADEIDALISAINWDKMFQADVPYALKDFRRKQDARALSSRIEFGLKKGFRLPPAVNTGQQVHFLLQRIALPYFDVASFDDLPTPYRAVATDLRAAETVILDRGNLVDAMRATMTIPGVFDPIVMGPRLLVDGGLLKNLPADVVRDMGADVVIAVDVGKEARGPRRYDTLLDVLRQTMDVVMLENSHRALAASSIVIRPELTGFGTMDWRRSRTLIERGYNAAEAASSTLLPLALDEAGYAAWKAGRAARRRTTPPTPQFVSVPGVSAEEQAVIRRRLAVHLSRPVDVARLNADLLALTGSDRYERIDYEFTRADGQLGLLVRVRPRENGPPFLAVAPVLGNAGASVFSMSVRGRMTAYDLVGRGSEARVDASAGTGLSASAELWLPLSRSRWFVAYHGSVSRTLTPGYSGTATYAEHRVRRADVGIDVGFTTGRWSEFRAGVGLAHVDATPTGEASAIPSVRGSERFTSVEWTFDGQDSPMIPSRGLFARVRAKRFAKVAPPGGTGPLIPTDYPDRFDRAEFDGSLFAPIGSRYRVFTRFGVGSTFGAHPLAPNDFGLGGPPGLSALRPNEIHGSEYMLFASGMLRSVARLPDMLGDYVFVGAWVENGTAFERLASARWHTHLSGGLVMETFLGPVFVAGSAGLDGHGRFYVGVGPFLR